MAREKISSDSGSEARTLESALQLRGEGGEELLRDRGLVRRAGEHPPHGGFDGPRLQRVDLAAPRGEREEGAPGIVRIALPGDDPAGLEPAEDSGQRARVHAEDLREGPGGPGAGGGSGPWFWGGGGGSAGGPPPRCRGCVPRCAPPAAAAP